MGSLLAYGLTLDRPPELFAHSATYDRVRVKVPRVQRYDFIWAKGLPWKTQLCMYKVVMGILHTLDRLGRFGILIGGHGCVFCNKDSESLNHISFYCVFTLPF